jgi:protein-L-isoaspartate(D-aspartate) O-methyltransferase
MDTSWRQLHDRLAAALIADGVGLLSDPAWRDAWDACPRHMFISDRVWLKDGVGYRAVTRGDPGFDWWGLVYSSKFITVQVDDGRTAHSSGTLGQRSTSSASQPALVADMLALADLRPGHRLLDIGAGTGWSSSVAAAYLGDENVTAVEIDPDLTAAAEANARRAGRRQAIVNGDGMAGWPPAGPFDRITLACSVSEVPAALIAQTAPGGKLVVPYSSSGYGGAVTVLTVDGTGGASGRFAAEAHFMHSRTQPPPVTPDAAGPVRERTSHLPAEAYASWPARTLLELAIPDLVIPAPRRRHDGWLWMTVRTPDGSKATAALHDPDAEDFEDCFDVYEYGRRDLWAEIEDAFASWAAAGRPPLDRHQLHVDADGTHHIVVG